MKRLTIALLLSVGLTAQAHAGLLTGLVLGYMFGASAHPESTVEHIKEEISPEDALYKEFVRNKEAAVVAEGVDKEALLRRNREIAAQIVKQAREKYVAQFDLKLNELKRTTIQTEAAQVHSGNDPVHNLDVLTKRLTFQDTTEPTAVSAERSQVLYGLGLGANSPLPISAFDIYADGKMLPVVNGVPQYSVQEQFGHNIVVFTFIKKDDHTVTFNISHEWDVSSALAKVSEVHQQEVEQRQETSSKLLMVAGICASILLIPSLLLSFVRNSRAGKK